MRVTQTFDNVYRAAKQGKRAYIYQFGDHDPSMRCVSDSIVRRRSLSAWRSPRKESGFSFEKVTFQIFGNQLREREIASSGLISMDQRFCVSVKETPDGFLNLREGPGMKFNVKAKLNIGDYLEADTQNKEWTRVTDKTGGVSGWVYSRYIDKLSDWPCW